MMRLIEQLEGTGSVSDRHGVLGDVRYHVRMYQKFHEPGRRVIQERRIEGSVTRSRGQLVQRVRRLATWRRSHAAA